MALTPMWESEFSPWSKDFRRWQFGAQQHYSLLDRLESRNLDAYHMGHPTDGIFNMRREHSNLNFIAIWADDILNHMPEHPTANDEVTITKLLPQKLNRETLIQSHAISAHFAFHPQQSMTDTDLRSRYRAYANEFVCGPDSQIPT